MTIENLGGWVCGQYRGQISCRNPCFGHSRLQSEWRLEKPLTKGVYAGLVRNEGMNDWPEELREKIREVFFENQRRGWDGYDADPIGRNAVYGAVALTGMLPDGIKKPEIVPEADGRIAF